MSNRKRKASNANTNRVFQERWTYDYFFVDVENKPVCLICNQPVSEFKEYNIKRHYISKHSSAYEKYKNEFRKDKVKELTKVLRGQQMVLSKASLQQESVVKASNVVAEIIAKKSKPFSDGEFIKECIVRVADVICPEKKETLAKISLSRQTITRRVEELGNSIEETLQKHENFHRILWRLTKALMSGLPLSWHSLCEELMTILKLLKNLQPLSQ